MIGGQEVHVDFEHEGGHRGPVDFVEAGFRVAGGDVPASIRVLFFEKQLTNLGMPLVPGFASDLVLRLNGVLMEIVEIAD